MGETGWEFHQFRIAITVVFASGAKGTTFACSTCHGQDLNGLGDVPRLAGISPLYTVRQLNDFRSGERAGTLASLMTLAVANLTDEDIVALAAYLGSLDP